MSFERVFISWFSVDLFNWVRVGGCVGFGIWITLEGIPFCKNFVVRLSMLVQESDPFSAISLGSRKQIGKTLSLPIKDRGIS